MTASGAALWQWSAARVAAATAAKVVSASEVTEAVLARIAAVNPGLNAVTLHLDDDARRRARDLDAALARGEQPGPLHGVPITIKDNVDVAGQRTPNGLPARAGAVAAEDSPVTRALREAGAVLVGRTNTPEVSMRPTTDNPLFGLTRNPWDASVSSGGSSGGAGAAGMGAIGHGSDIAGSIRIPALHCGVAGLKPTFGRVPAYVPGLAAERPTVAALMAVQGPLARTVEDLELALTAMSAPDARDPWSVPAPLAGPPAERIAVVVRHVGAQVSTPGVVAAVDRAAQALRAAGWQVRDVDEAATPGVAEPARLAFRLLMTDLDHELTPVVRAAGSATMQAYWQQLLTVEEPLHTIPEYLDALARRTTLLRAWSVFLQRCPLVVLPQMTGPLLTVGQDVRSAADTHAVWDGLRPSIAVNLLGLPAVLAPTGLDEQGLPTGVQLVAGRFREDVCLAAARDVEAAWPPLAPQLWQRVG